jgi:beta-lactam-binding protein with PASTA domain
VLYESVTGTVPFVADTTLGTLRARVGASLPPNRALGPLDDVLARAAAPEKEDRLDAAGFAARLGALASALPTPQPLPFRPPQPEAPLPAGGFLPPELAEQTQVRMPVIPTAPVGTKAGPGELFDAEPLGDGKAKAAAGGVVMARPRKNRKKLYWTLAAVIVVLALVAGGLVAAKQKVFTPSHPAPTLVGLTLARAHAAASKDHFTLHLDHGIMSTTVPAGSVISQTPKVGTVLKEGSTLTVVPSIGPPPVTIPNLGGMTCAQAATTLTAIHLKSVCGAPQYSNTVASGVLLEWAYGSTPNPTHAPYGSTITLVPSQGHAPVAVPDFPAGYTYAQAQAAIQAVGLVAAEAPATNPTVPAGQLISSDPASGASVPFGSTVTVAVSTGPPTVAVPNVISETIAQATATLQGAGLVVAGVSGDPSKMAKGTVPPTGAVVPTGSSVTILTH